MSYLITCGHRRIGYAGETSSEVWYQAYLDTLRESGLEYSRSLTSDYLQNGVGDYRGAKHLLETASPLPTTMFCATDIAAIIALRHFIKTEIKMSEQLFLISMSDIELSGYVSPIPTTAGMPTAEVGDMTVQTLVDRIQKWHELPMEILLPSKLAIRENAADLSGGVCI